MAVTSIDAPESPSSEADKSQLRREGFIDEALVQKMVMSHTYQRQQVKREELAMSSNDEDYAGWNLPSSPSFGRAA
jgi:hypothetical protein